MIQSEIGIGLAFLMGMLSFLTPCVLPLVPVYLSFISGYSVSELRKMSSSRSVFPVMSAAISFIFGFSLIFILMGLGASALASFLVSIKQWLLRIAGLVVVILGLQMMGILKFNFLVKEKRWGGEIKARGLSKAFIFGVVFAFGWTPCVGPILGGILMLAAEQDTMLRGAILLVFYSLGMGIPFLLSAILLDSFFEFFGWLKPRLRSVELVAGGILVIVGFLIFIEQFDKVKIIFDRILPPTLRSLG